MAWTVIAAGAILRIASYLLSANAGGDAGARLALAARWLREPSLKVFFEVYPPGHFYLIGLFTAIFRDVVVGGRLLSLALGIGSLVVLWKLAQGLYGERAGMLSAAVFALYSLHIGYSTTSSSEVPYLFFLLLSLLFFFSDTRANSHQPWRLVVSGLAMSVAESIRFEAWIIFAALVFVLLWWWFRDPIERKSWSGVWPVLRFSVAGGLWPVLMMAYSWRTTGDPMYLVNLNQIRVVHYMASAPTSFVYQLGLIPAVLLIGLSPLALAAAVYGMAKSFDQKGSAAYAGVTLFFAAIQAYKILSHGLQPTARYSITLGALLAVTAGYGMDLLCEKFAARRVQCAQGGAIAFLAVNTLLVLAASELPSRYANSFASVSPVLRYQTRISSVAAYLRSHLRPDDAVVIDNYNVESNIVANAAGLPLLPGKRAYLASKGNDTDVRDYIKSEHPRFLVYADQGTLRSSLTLPQGCGDESAVNGITFHCAYANQIYRVYELSYP